MKKRTILLILAAIMTAVCFTGCNKDSDDNNGNGGNNQGGGDSPYEYPSTANVILNAVTDIDGNKYDAVKIGDQVWMAQSLRTTRYADGTSIPLGTSSLPETPCRYAPGLDYLSEAHMANVEKYGYLYNWSAVMYGANSSNANPSGVQGICPKNWHVPSAAEWGQLIHYMKTQPMYFAGNDSDYLAKALAATWGWVKINADIYDPGDDTATNNASGFSALPAGNYRTYNAYFGYNAEFWSTKDVSNEEAQIYCLSHSTPYVIFDKRNKREAISVRCVRD